MVPKTIPHVAYVLTQMIAWAVPKSYQYSMKFLCLHLHTKLSLKHAVDYWLSSFDANTCAVEYWCEEYTLCFTAEIHTKIVPWRFTPGNYSWNGASEIGTSPFCVSFPQRSNLSSNLKARSERRRGVEIVLPCDNSGHSKDWQVLNRQKQALSPKYTVGFHFPRMQSSQTTFLSAPIKGNRNTQGLCITNSQQRNKSICTTQTAPAKPQQCGFTKCKHRIAIRGESHATNSSGNNYSNILDHLLKNVFQEETFLTGRPCGVSRLKIKRNGTHIRKKFSRTKNSQPHIIHLKWTLTVDWTSSTCNENTWYKRTLFEKCCAAQNKHPAVIAHPL